MLKALLLTLLGLSYAGFSVVSVFDGRALDSRGKTTQIEPVERLTETTYKKRNTPDRLSYSGEISFVTEEGKTVKVKKTLPASLIESVMQGKPVQIRYLPDRPTTTRLEGEMGSGAVDVAVGSIVLLFGGLWFRKKLLEKPTLD
jgi:hypothetical protein